MVPALQNTEDAVQCLRAGGVLLLATDTLPGLHCCADDEAAVQRIIGIKGRAAGKSMLVLAGSVSQAQQVTAPWSEAMGQACRECWPGPFSLILPNGKGAQVVVMPHQETLAVRVPDVPSLQQLILAVGCPLVSTSANRAGDAPMVNLEAAAQEFGAEIDGFWAGGDCPEAAAQASALVDLTSLPFQILRPGPLAFPSS